MVLIICILEEANDVFDAKMGFFDIDQVWDLKDSTKLHQKHAGWSYYHERVRRRQQSSKFLIG